LHGIVLCGRCSRRALSRSRNGPRAAAARDVARGDAPHSRDASAILTRAAEKLDAEAAGRDAERRRGVCRAPRPPNHCPHKGPRGPATTGCRRCEPHRAELPATPMRLRRPFAANELPPKPMRAAQGPSSRNRPALFRPNNTFFQLATTRNRRPPRLHGPRWPLAEGLKTALKRSWSTRRTTSVPPRRRLRPTPASAHRRAPRGSKRNLRQVSYGRSWRIIAHVAVLPIRADVNTLVPDGLKTGWVPSAKLV
jgi:hypothetical protein